VTRKHAHYLFTVKANQPTLLDRSVRLPWHRVPELDRTRDRAHGRVELRTLKAVSVGGFGFPHAAQVVQVTRRVRDLRTRRWRTVTVYAATSLTFAQASPARLADLLGGHWGIENSLHYVRDVTFCEDACRSAWESNDLPMGALPGCRSKRGRLEHPTRPRSPRTSRRRRAVAAADQPFPTARIGQPAVAIGLQ
jgi:hypothetical protein